MKRRQRSQAIRDRDAIACAEGTPVAAVSHEAVRTCLPFVIWPLAAAKPKAPAAHGRDIRGSQGAVFRRMPEGGVRRSQGREGVGDRGLEASTEGTSTPAFFAPLHQIRRGGRPFVIWTLRTLPPLLPGAVRRHVGSGERSVPRWMPESRVPRSEECQVVRDGHLESSTERAAGAPSMTHVVRGRFPLVIRPVRAPPPRPAFRAVRHFCGGQVVSGRMPRAQQRGTLGDRLRA
jgi:hypothetical protein